MFQKGHTRNTKPYDKLMEDLKNSHPDIKFDFSNITKEWYENNYKSGKTELPIICPKHGQINSSYEYFRKRKFGCILCSKSQPQKMTYELLMERLNNSKNVKNGNLLITNITKEWYEKNYKDKGKAPIICKHHGDMPQILRNIWEQDVGCFKCGRNECGKKQIEKQKKTIIEDFKGIWGDLYDYSKFEYINAIEKSNVICKKKNHGEFLVSPNNHKRGKGCPKCVNKTQTQVYSFIKDTFDNDVGYERAMSWCPNKRYDIIIEELKLIIEVDGRQHFEIVTRFRNDVEKNKENDKYKMVLALENGYSMIRIFQEDIYNKKIDWKNILKDKIKKYETPTIEYIGEIYKSHF